MDDSWSFIEMAKQTLFGAGFIILLSKPAKYGKISIVRLETNVGIVW